MRIQHKLSLATLLILLSVSWKSHENPYRIIQESQEDISPKELFNQKCMICHSAEGKNAATMLAPPFYPIKKRYLMASMNKQDFIESMTYWVLNPMKENSLMPGAVQQFSVMPKLGYSEKDIKLISTYIYENDMPKPDWFDAHQEAHRMNKAH